MAAALKSAQRKFGADRTWQVSKVLSEMQAERQAHYRELASSLDRKWRSGTRQRCTGSASRSLGSAIVRLWRIALRPSGTCAVEL